MRIGALGCVSSLGALAVVSLTGPHLTSDLSMPYIAAVIAGVETLARLIASQGATLRASRLHCQGLESTECEVGITAAV